MHREIKFRAWDKRLRKFNDITLTFGLAANNGRLNRIEDFVYQQFTGLKDKNGKEIYEGDIVTFYKTTSEVFFRHGSFATYLEGTTLGDGLGWIEMSQNSFNDQFEVIGNIYENPELLKEPRNDT